MPPVTLIGTTVSVPRTNLPTSIASTFDEYADLVFIPYMLSQLQHSLRVDIVWDAYTPDSLKESTREKRGVGVRRKVAGKTKLPANWSQFLRDPANQTELFGFLSSKVASISVPAGKALHITSGKWYILHSGTGLIVCVFKCHFITFALSGQSVTSCGSAATLMSPCNHEEADTRIVIHVIQALQSGCTSVLVRTVDTDVVVILVGKFGRLIEERSDADIWIAFGMGKHFTFISVNKICTSLGETRARCLLVFHALTGCDTTSAFVGKGKHSAWKAWQLYDEVTPALAFLAENPFQHLDVDSDHFRRIERLAVVMYDKTCPCDSINEARKELFCKHNRAMDKLPPTEVPKTC